MIKRMGLSQEMDKSLKIKKSHLILILKNYEQTDYSKRLFRLFLTKNLCVYFYDLAIQLSFQCSCNVPLDLGELKGPDRDIAYLCFVSSAV